MGAQVIATIVLNTRTGRRILGAACALILVVIVLALTPLIAVPFAAAGSTVNSSTVVAMSAETAPVTNGMWGYPLRGGYSKGRGFGYNPVEGCSYCSVNHEGYDMSQACGATVYAAGPGRVITAGAYQGYGNAVLIDHGGNLITLYGHMQWGSLRVVLGQAVAAGAPLGAEGNTGRSFGCHLHFEVRKSGTAVDPQPFMAGLGLPLK